MREGRVLVVYLVKQLSQCSPRSFTDSTYEYAWLENSSSPTWNALVTRRPRPFPGLSNLSTPSIIPVISPLRPGDASVAVTPPPTSSDPLRTEEVLFGFLKTFFKINFLKPLFLYQLSGFRPFVGLYLDFLSLVKLFLFVVHGFM